MSLKRLTTIEMLQLSSPWVTAGSEQRKQLLSMPEVSGLLPRLDQAHQALLHAQPALPGGGSAAVTDVLSRVDARHDNLVRGIHEVLTGFASLQPDAEFAGRLLALRDKLLPDGISSTQLSYREEAQHAALAESRLDDADRALLQSLPVPGSSLSGQSQSLAGAVTEWLQTARRLDELEDQQALQQRTRIAEPSPTDELPARNKWIRVVTALATNLELGAQHESSAAEIWNNIRASVRMAERRGSVDASDENADWESSAA